MNNHQQRKYSFSYVLNIMPHRRQMVPVTVYYIRQLDKSVAKVEINYTTITTTTKNHDLTQCYYPNLNYIPAGDTAMLLQNYIFWQGLMNGSVGRV